MWLSQAVEVNQTHRLLQKGSSDASLGKGSWGSCSQRWPNGDLPFHPISCRPGMASCKHGALTWHVHVRTPPPCRPKHRAKPQCDARQEFHRSLWPSSDLCQLKIWLMKPARLKGQLVAFYSPRGCTEHGRLRTEQPALCQRPGKGEGQESIRSWQGCVVCLSHSAESCGVVEQALGGSPRQAAPQLSGLSEPAPSPGSTCLA